MEVLISVFVLSVGLLGLAALLPVGSYTILETIKADRAGDCGRAALRDVKVRRMLDPSGWFDGSGSAVAGSLVGASFWIDPLGLSKSAPATVASGSISGGTLSRVNGGWFNFNLTPPQWAPLTPAQAQAIFTCPDDLIVTLPELMSPAQPFGRSRLMFNPSDPITGGNTPSFAGDYSWFLSVTRVYYSGTQTFDPSRFRVSAVICYKRDFGGGTPAERAVSVPTTGFFDGPGGVGSVAFGGGSIQLSGPINDTPGSQLGVRVREGDWVALYSSSNGLCSWYRVIAVSPDSTYLTLNGPDWQVTGQDYVLAIGQSVLGVYTTTVELDQDPAWQQ
jgi:hypothetical protein